MSYLIEIDHRNNQILRPEVMKMVISFEALTEKEMLAVVLHCDYHSIYKQFPDHERKRKAMYHAFDDNIPKFWESNKIVKAVDDYMRLQYNPKIEVSRKYQQKIDKFLQLLENDDSPTSVKKTTDAIASLRQSIAALEKEIDEETLNEGVVKGKMTLSWLEKIQASSKQYDNILKNK